MKSMTTLHLVKLGLVLVLLALSIGAIVADIQAQMTPGYRFEKEILLLVLSGDNTEAIDKLRPALKARWTDRFNIVEMEATKATLIQVGREVDADKAVLIEVQNIQTWKEKDKWHAVIPVNMSFADVDQNEFVYSELRNAIGKSTESKKDAMNLSLSALDLVAETISKRFSEKFSLEARIIDRTEDLVTFDIGRNAGLKRGTRFDVFFNNKRLGLIEVIEVQEKSAKAKILRGGSKIKVGASIKEKFYTSDYWGVSITHSFLPAKGGPGWRYERATGRSVEHIDGAILNFCEVTFGSIFKKGAGGIGIGFGLFSCSDLLDGWQSELKLTTDSEIVPELLYYFIGGGIGFGCTDLQWARGGTDYYNEFIKNSDRGKEDDWFGLFEVFTGLKLTFASRFDIFGEIGYMHYWSEGKVELVEDRNDDGDADDEGEAFKFPSEWLRYKDLSLGGLKTTIGLAVHF